GSYTVSFISQNGCDSTYTINLTVEPVISITEEVNLCQGQTHILPDGTEVNTEGIYEVVVSGAECDSVFEVTLIINPVYNLQFDAEICADENYTLPDGSMVNMGGLYNSNLETVSGCDSIIETFLIVHELPELSISMEATFCSQPGSVPIHTNPEGGTIFFNGSSILGDSLNLNSVSAGNYSVGYEFTNPVGCSNSVTHGFTVLPVISPEFSHSVSCL